MKDAEAALERDPTLADALMPLGTLAALIGVSTLLHMPHAVSCHARPVLSVLYGFTGFRVERTEPTQLEEDP
jgi:hypothetical protein